MAQGAHWSYPPCTYSGMTLLCGEVLPGTEASLKSVLAGQGKGLVLKGAQNTAKFGPELGVRDAWEGPAGHGWITMSCPC